MSFFKSKKVAQQKTEIENLTQERDELRQSQEITNKRAEDNESRADELQRSVNVLQTENAQLKEKLNTDEPYDKVFKERQDLIEDKGNNNAKIEELENIIHSKNEEIESLKITIENTTKEKEISENAEKKTEDVMQELETLKQKNEELESERVELDNRIDDLEKKNSEFEDEMVKLQQDFDKLKEEKAEMNTLMAEQQDEELSKNRAYIEDLRKELNESKNKVDSMLLESEALKSENESLFRANESKKEDITEMQKEVTSIKNELKIERLRYKKLKEDWDEEKKSTEFVLVSKSARSNRNQSLETFKEENDSEDEHVVGVVEAARAEREELKKKENQLKKQINRLEKDKEELFRSGTNLFSENKSLSVKYDQVVGERTTLLQVEAALKRKVNGQEQEIKDMKKTIDDMYYQNMAIRRNEDSESKRGSYVVVMGNEMIKQLEREKSSLYRRVKFLEQENSEIEARVIELEKQSEQLVNYTRKYDKHPNLPDVRRNGDYEYNSRPISRDRLSDKDLNRGSQHGRGGVRVDELIRRNEKRGARGKSRRDERDRRNSPDRYFDYRPPSGKRMPYEEKARPRTILPTRSPDYYKNNEPPFNNSVSRQTSIGPTSVRSIHSLSSHISLPPLGSSGSQSPRPTIQSPRYQDSRRITPLTTRR